MLVATLAASRLKISSARREALALLQAPKRPALQALLSARTSVLVSKVCPACHRHCYGLMKKPGSTFSLAYDVIANEVTSIPSSSTVHAAVLILSLFCALRLRVASLFSVPAV